MSFSLVTQSRASLRSLHFGIQRRLVPLSRGQHELTYVATTRQCNFVFYLFVA